MKKFIKSEVLHGELTDEIRFVYGNKYRGCVEIYHKYKFFEVYVYNVERKDNRTIAHMSADKSTKDLWKLVACFIDTLDIDCFDVEPLDRDEIERFINQ